MTESLAVKTMRVPARIALCACVASIALAGGFVFAEAGTKKQVIMIAGLAGATLVVVTPIRIGLVLVGWILLLTYNRQYYSFDGVYGDFGSEGLYWIPADAALVGLAGLHAIEVWRNRLSLGFSRTCLAAFAPFILVSALASLGAVHPTWAFAEWLRWAKVGVAVVLLQRILRGPNWWFAIVGLGLAVTAQSFLGATQVAMNTSTGLLSMLTGKGAADAAIGVGVTEAGRVRASGTMVHPNILGPFLLFVLPIFLALLVDSKQRWVRIAAGVVCLTGYIGLIATMSRLPIAIGGLQAACVLVCLVVMRGTSLKRVIALVSFVGIATVLGSAYFFDAIAHRITGDLKESISFRADYNRVALQIWREHPFFGIGLNNFRDGLDQYDPKLSGIVNQMQEGRKRFGIRAAAPVHNLFLLVLAETGLVGLTGYLALLAVALSIAWKSARRASGAAQLVCLGIAIGFAGQYVQQTMDFSMWMDPGLFAFVLLFVLVSQPPVTPEPPSARASTERPSSGRRTSSTEWTPPSGPAPYGGLLS